MTPAFVIFEPPRADEEIGPVAGAAARLVALLQIAASPLIRAIRSVVADAAHRARVAAVVIARSMRVSRGLPAFAIDSPSPIVALVGVFAPKLIAARSVIDACTAGRNRLHRRRTSAGTCDARDNLKRWVMASLPDALRWTPIHREIIDAWHHAAEDAADDAATGGEEIARAELAALLLKIVRLAPQPQWNAAIVSPFVEEHGLERRVRRLLRPELEPPAPLAIVPMVALTAIVDRDAGRGGIARRARARSSKRSKTSSRSAADPRFRSPLG